MTMWEKTNFHTHTTFCDGKNTPQEMADAAFAKGFTRLGFSGHSYTAYDESYCMSKEGTREYKNEVLALQKAYVGKMEIYCGIEQDFYAEQQAEDFDYIIGSVHAIFADGAYHNVDESPETMKRTVQVCFGGDYLRYAEQYFETEAQVAEKTKADIVGHFDLITKFNEGDRYFDTQSKRYRFSALEAMEELLKKDIPFEINTGAISRGYRKEPYPDLFLLKELQKRGGKILLSSDSHSCDSLDFGFEDAKERAKVAGFRSVLCWTAKGWEEMPL